MDQEQELQTSRICTQRFSDTHETIIHRMHQENKHSLEEIHALSAAFSAKKVWPVHEIITIGFFSGSDTIQRTPTAVLKHPPSGTKLDLDPLQEKSKTMTVLEAIQAVVEERIQPLVNMKLEFVDDVKTAMIRISFDSTSGAWSLVGTDCTTVKDPTKATMNLGWFDVPTTIHEFGHAMGMIHEHQNPKENPIKWDKEKVYAWAERTQGWSKKMTDTNILNAPHEQLNGSAYDSESIMLYFFPGKLTKDGNGSHQNLRLSKLDVIWLHNMYGRTDTKNVVNPETYYKNVYGEPLSSTSSGTSIYKYALIGLVLILIVVGVYYYVMIYRKNKK